MSCITTGTTKFGIAAMLLAAMAALPAATAFGSAITLIGGTTNDGNFDAGTGFTVFSAPNYTSYQSLYSGGTTGTPEWTVTSGYTSGTVGFIDYSTAAESGSNLYVVNAHFAGTITSESTLGYTVNTGDVFTISLDVRANIAAGTATISPTLNFAGTSVTLTSHVLSETTNYQTARFTYTATSADIGSLKSIALYVASSNNGQQTYADNAVLSVASTSVPAPATLNLMAVGALGLLLLRRKTA